MFANVLRLELKKQRKDFLIIVGFAAIVMVCFLVEAVLKNRNLIEFVRDVFGFLSFGFVFVLAISGASSAHHLRREPYKSADELLPFKPAQRTVGSYFVNLLYLLVGSSVFMCATYFFGASKEIAKGIDWLNPSVAIFLIIHFHMLCFILAYWMNHSALAIVISGLIVWCEFLLIRQKTFFSYFLHNPSVSIADATLSLGSVLSLIGGFVGGLIALRLISNRIEKERNLRWVPGVVASLILITGIILLLVDLMRTSYTAQTKLFVDNYAWWTNEYLNPTPTSQEGVYLNSNIGNILYVNSEQRKVLRKTPINLFSKPKQFDLAAMYHNQKSGELWAIIRNDEPGHKDYGIWKSNSGEELKLHSEFNSRGFRPLYIVKCADHLCLFAHYWYGSSKETVNQKKIAYATIGATGLSEWNYFDYETSEMGFLGAIRTYVFQNAVEKGEVAVLSNDKTYLIRNLPAGTTQQWSLPGKGDLPSFIGFILTPAFHKNGQPYFVIPVKKENKFALFACGPDGKVFQLWNKTWTDKERLTREALPAGGEAWVVREAQSWKPIEALVINENGNLFPPFRVEITSEDSYFVDFVKRENSLVWILTEARLSKVDLQSGKILKKFDIEADKSDWQNIFRSRKEEGVYFVKDDRICLIDWNGKVKDLGPATLN